MSIDPKEVASFADLVAKMNSIDAGNTVKPKTNHVTEGMKANDMSAILENMYRVSGRNAPWYFWQVLDSRTLIQMLREDPRKQFQTNLHKADDDAYYQSKAIQIALKDLGVFG